MSRTLLSLAGFQVIINGRFWVIAEDWERSYTAVVVERIDGRCVLFVIGVVRWNQPVPWNGDSWMLCRERKGLEKKFVALSLECELAGRDRNRVIFSNVLLRERGSAAAAGKNQEERESWPAGMS